LSRHLGKEFDDFLRAVLPDLGLNWRRHRRRGVRRKIADRMTSLGIRSLEAYRERLAADPAETAHFAVLLGVTISRFFREADVFRFIGEEIFPGFAGRERVRLFSAGCAGGEEPYSLALLWREKGPPGVRAVILALDMDAESLARAVKGMYPVSSLKEAPENMKTEAFRYVNGQWQLYRQVREMVQFYRGDFRTLGPPPNLDLAMCRNMAYTYFTRPQQREITRALADAIRPGGYLVVGAKEKPDASGPFQQVYQCIYRRTEK
jgi:chemotaxis methyl-accepting protein methylase